MAAVSPARGHAKLLAVVAAVLVIGLTAATGTWSVWNAETRNPGNDFTSGTVDIGTDGPATTLFDVSAMRPGIPIERCLTVRYRGTIPAAVRMYSTVSPGSGLERYLTVTVTRGTGVSEPGGDCGDFTADTADPRDLGPGVLHRGLLGDFPSTYADGVRDPETGWAAGEGHGYRLSVELAAVNAAQGRSATAAFSWEGR